LNRRKEQTSVNVGTVFRTSWHREGLAGRDIRKILDFVLYDGEDIDDAELKGPHGR
jgi:hypothetical protein